MKFSELVQIRQSCRKYDPLKEVEDDALLEILRIARLAPSACNSQPYHITVCKGDTAKQVAKETQGMGMNKFTTDAPIMFVISEEQYSTTAGFGSKIKHNDYRSIDIGILSAYITAAATEFGLSTCILGWFNDKSIRNICNLQNPVRLVISLGYAKQDDVIRTKKRKEIEEFVSIIQH